MQTGTALYHAQWIAAGQPPQSTAITEFGSLLTTPEGYPYGTASNTSHDIEDQGDCSVIFSNILQAGAPTITAVANLAAVVGVQTDLRLIIAAMTVCTTTRVNRHHRELRFRP